MLIPSHNYTSRLLIVPPFSPFKHTPWAYTMNKYANIYVSRTNMLTQHAAIKIESHVKIIFILGTENFKENRENINCWRCVHVLVIKWVWIPTLVKSHEAILFPNVFSRLQPKYSLQHSGLQCF